MRFDRIDSFRKKLATSAVVGPFSKSMDPAFVEVMGYSGFDFLVLDMEHGPNNIATMQNLIRAAEVSGILPIVRVPENSPQLISAALDIGAGGVQIPQIESAEMARKVVDACRYAPGGRRGVCRFVRNANYSATEKNLYFETANRSLVILQIEGIGALDSLPAILDVDGIDIIFIGPYDLSQSLGITGDVQNPRVKSAALEIIETCRARGVATGIFVETASQAADWISRGVSYICYSVDVGIFYETCRREVNDITDRLSLMPTPRL